MQPLEPALLLEHAQFVRALARSLVRDPGSADDIEQETWVRALQRAPREHTDLRAWLATVMNNLLRNRQREQARRTQREERAARSERLPPSALAAERSDTLRSLVSAVVELDEPYRSTLLSLYFEGLSTKELADREGVPHATVRSRHQRALARMRARLDRDHGSRDAWCGALTPFAAIEEVGRGLLTIGLATAGVAVTALVLAAGWWLRAPNKTSDAAPELASAATLPPATDAPASPPTAAVAGERSELDAGQIALLGAVEDFDPNQAALGARPARGAQVRVSLVDRERNTLAESELVTDEDGAFEWRLADPGARPLSFQVSAAETLDVRAGSGRAPLDSDADRAARVTVRRKALADVELLVQRIDGSPLANAQVELLKRDNATRLERACDANGVVRFERSSDFGRFELRAPGWSPVSYRAPSEQPDGSWARGSIVAAASGSLSVRVVDERGAALDDADVLVARQRWERDLSGDSQWGAPMELGDLSAHVDSNGVATFAAVTADTDLRVRVVRGRETLSASQRSPAGELLGLESEGLAIRVAPGGSEQLVARWSERFELALDLARSDGAPLQRVELTVLDAGRPLPNERGVHESVEQSPSETVRIPLHAPRFIGPLVVFARESRAGDELLAFSGSKSAGQARNAARALSMAWRTVELPERARDGAAQTLTLSLQLEPTGSIRGQLIGRDGAPALHQHGGMGGVRVSIVPSGVSRVAAQTLMHPRSRVEYLGASQFVAHDLPPGRYDVLVSEQIDNFYTFGATEERFGPFEPGGDELSLRLGAPGVVRVRLASVVDTTDAELRTTTLMASLRPRDEAALSAENAPPHQVIEGLAPWPTGAPRNFTGIGGEQNDAGAWSYGLDGRRGAGPFELPALGPGWYRFGVDVRCPSGARFAPAASPLAYYAPGEYEITLHPQRVSDLRGVVRRDAMHLAAVELFDSKGRPVQFNDNAGGATSVTRVYAPSMRELVLYNVPHGRYELRAGPPAQLDRGEFRRRIAVEVNDASEPFELDLR